MIFKELPTPCYVVDESLIEKNLKILKDVQDRTGAKILLAQKAFSMFSIYPLIKQYLYGTTASGLYEARLGYEEMGGEVHVFSAAYRDEEIDEIIKYSDPVSYTHLDVYKRQVPYTNQAPPTFNIWGMNLWLIIAIAAVLLVIIIIVIVIIIKNRKKKKARRMKSRH